MAIDHPIFLKSIEFIRSKLNSNQLNYLETKVLERLIHTSGDFSIQELLDFSNNACETSLNALKNGAPILTDTDMAAIAIKSMIKKTGRNIVYSAMKWGIENKDASLTQTAYGIEKGWSFLLKEFNGSPSPVVVFGSSPTALEKLLDILEKSNISPSLIVGMPVGFIGVEKSKIRLKKTNYPYIVLNSSRGGASMAAASVNALLRELI